MSFNRRVASGVYETIMKMDDASAEMLVRAMVFDVHLDDIENNKRVVTSAITEINKSMFDAAMKTSGREEISKAISLVQKDRSDLHTKYWNRRNADGEFAKLEDAVEGSVFIHEGKIKHARSDDEAKEIALKGGFNVTQALGHYGEAGNTFGEAWHKKGLDGTNNSQTYSRIEAGSRLLAASSTDPRAQVAAQAGIWAGQFGPEAEKIVGPSMRRATYRYRGTERRPDENLDDIKGEIDRQTMRSTGQELTVGNHVKNSMNAAKVYFGGSKAMNVRGRLPARDRMDLQLQSGKVPPSEGVIINADGNIITQAVGYADDHYLPFNLKNLKGLQGGSYVRTRSIGGPTSEDIYTGLISGARSLTVVSHSGIFTINFNDDFRGGRRYNDKAKQMVGQYQHTLDAIQSKNVKSRSLKPEEKADIRDEVEEKMGKWSTREQIEVAVKAKEKAYLANPTLSKKEIADIEDRAKLGNEDNPREERKQRAEFIDNAMEEKKRNVYQLDGEGYAAALDAMREQFPYYIEDVEYMHRRGGLRNGEPLDRDSEALRAYGTGSDKGYVKPGYLRPTDAKSGWFGYNIGAGKHSAEEDNWANWSHNRLNNGGTVAQNNAPAVPATAAAAAAVAAGTIPGQAAHQQVAAARAAAQSNAQLAAMVETTRVWVDANTKVMPVLASVSHLDETAMNEWLAATGNREKLVRDLEKTAAWWSSQPAEQAQGEQLKASLLAYKTTASSISGDPWKGVGTPSGLIPATFDGPEYKSGAFPEQYEAKIAEMSHEISGVNEASTDAQLRNMSSYYGALHNLINDPENLALQTALASAFYRASDGSDEAEEQHNVILAQAGADKAGVLAMVADHQERIERLRRIKVAELSTRSFGGRGAGSPGAVAITGPERVPTTTPASVPSTVEEPEAKEEETEPKTEKHRKVIAGQLFDMSLAIKQDAEGKHPADQKYAKVRAEAIVNLALEVGNHLNDSEDIKTMLSRVPTQDQAEAKRIVSALPDRSNTY